MRVVLIGNYRPDGQQSMERYARMLETGINASGHSVEIWYPLSPFGRFAKSTLAGFGKWLGYLDKWLIFPVILAIRSMATRSEYFHVCDHSNAPYIAWLPRGRASITCHDVLAIRGALGFEDSYCEASRFGKVLQSWIRKHLVQAPKVAAVSQLTMNQLLELSGKKATPDGWRVIHNAFNADFHAMPTEESSKRFEDQQIDLPEQYILHVGSNLPRKNRELLLKSVQMAGSSWSGSICFAGTPMDNRLRDLAKQLQLLDRVFELKRPDHETLVALYSRAHALVFPSFSEGFGWPVIEAQACGCPVIASDVDPMPEVSGGAAVHAAPENVEAFSDALIKLDDEAVRSNLIGQGLENAKRFQPQTMIDAYLDLIFDE